MNQHILFNNYIVKLNTLCKYLDEKSKLIDFNYSTKKLKLLKILFFLFNHFVI